jgi:hypothetical protein
MRKMKTPKYEVGDIIIQEYIYAFNKSRVHMNIAIICGINPPTWNSCRAYVIYWLKKDFNYYDDNKINYYRITFMDKDKSFHKI